MADFTAKDVQALRQATGVGMMDAKKALTESGGDFDAARTEGEQAVDLVFGKILAVPEQAVEPAETVAGDALHHVPGRLLDLLAIDAPIARVEIRVFHAVFDGERRRIEGGKRKPRLLNGGRR
jgi:hypothetical protein